MKETSDAADADLAARAQAGDRGAFDKLVRRYKVSLFRFVRRYIGNENDTYDIIQETFISAWCALSRYNRRQSFSTWLRAIALNKCRDYGRRQSVRSRFLRLFGSEAIEIAERDSELDIEHDAIEAKRLRRLDQAIAALPSFYKEPLLLTLVTGLSQQETAIQLNTTTKAIEMRIRRARKKLIDALSDLAGEK